MRSVTIYQRGDALLLSAVSQTNDEFWVVEAPYLRVDAGAPDAAVGEAALEALEGSRAGIASPPPDTDLFAPMLELAGVPSYDAFVSGARCVDIQEESGRFTLIPMRNLGPSEGFDYIAGSDVVVDEPAAAELGAAVRHALVAAE